MDWVCYTYSGFNITNFGYKQFSRKDAKAQRFRKEKLIFFILINDSSGFQKRQNNMGKSLKTFTFCIDLII